jgi:hypothetical protein
MYIAIVYMKYMQKIDLEAYEISNQQSGHHCRSPEVTAQIRRVGSKQI